MKPAVIKVAYKGPNNVEMDCQTNGTPKGTIIGALQVIIKQLATDMVNEAKQVLGPNASDDAITKYLDMQRQQPGQN